MVTPSKSINETPWYEKLIFVAAPFLIGLSAWLHIVLPAESDKGWLLYAARMWLQGQKLYVDIVESNPPLIMWIYSVPVWISLHVSWVTDYGALACIGLVCSMLSILAGTRLIRLHPAFAGNAVRQAEFTLLQGLIFIFYTTQLYFFDRDHIFLVLTFPYMLRFMPSLAAEKLPVRLRVLVGCMAAVGFCIKPHTIIVFAALQLFALLREKTFASLLNLENYIIVATGILYLLCTLYFMPEYIWTVVPMAVATYSDFANFGSGYAYLPPIFISMGLVFADFRPWYVTPYRKDVYYFAGLCLAFLIYALANNGWGYTYNPLYCMVLFTAGWMLWEYDWLKREHKARQLPMSRISFGIRGCILVFLMQGAFMLMYLFFMSHAASSLRTPCQNNPECWRQEGPFIGYTQEHHIHSFGTLSLDFTRWVMLLRLPDVRWDARFNHLWMVPKLVHRGESYVTSHYWILDYVGKSLADNLTHNKPDIVFVDSSPGFMGLVRRFDYAVFLSRVAEFRSAWSHYRYADTIDTCGVAMYGIPSECRYDIYARVP